MKKMLLIVLLCTPLFSLFSQSTFNGTLSATDNTFNRPDEGTPPTSLSITGTHVYYQVITLHITTPGLVTIISTSLWDNFAILYGTGGFNPTEPLTNALVANDDFAGPNSGFTYNFTTPGSYPLVICSYKNNVTGAYIITTSVAIVLPVKLVSFTASKTTGQRNLVQWTTTDEQNIVAYRVQRSNDNKQYHDIPNGSVTAKNSSNGGGYNVIDNNPVKGNNYYRLTITEENGHSSTSGVVLVKNNELITATPRVFPNPGSNVVKLEIKGMQANYAHAAVITASGKVLQAGEYRFNNDGILTLNITRLPAGSYFLKTVIAKETTIVPFVKQ